MSKEHYVVNCYTCQHNGQETYKGCNTLLNGEDEPYQNWKLREDLEQKDNKIADLQSQLATTEKALELACEDIIGSCEYCSYNTMPECPIEADCLDEKINYFKTEAKEMLENE